METSGRSTECMVTCDSKAIKSPLGIKMQIKQSDQRLNTVTLKGNDFFSTIRNKLMWGADLRN